MLRSLKQAFVELMAVACEHGAPQYFATFTANEMGWTDLHRACYGTCYRGRPVQATRHYNHRWRLFKQQYLNNADSPIGHIERT